MTRRTYGLRRSSVGGLLASALLATGCGASQERSPSAASSAQPRLFRTGGEKIVVRSKEDQGGQAQVFFVLAGQGRRKPLAAAKECVRRYLRTNKAAFCFAFTSSRALERAHVDRENGDLERLCWRAHWGHALSGDEDGAAGGPLEGPGRC